MNATGIERLSGAQAAFASERGACVGAAAACGGAGAVFMYRSEGWYTHRWLVAASGDVLDTATFRNRAGYTC